MSFSDELKEKIGRVAGRKEFLDFIEEKKLKSYTKIDKFFENEVKRLQRALAKLKSRAITQERRSKVKELAFIKKMRDFYIKNVK